MSMSSKMLWPNLLFDPSFGEGGLSWLISGANMKAYLKAGSPNRHMLYSAAWRLGFTVNGLRAAD